MSDKREGGKKATTDEEAWDIQETYQGKPCGWVQWKGTDACMDIKCKCGHLSHVDSEFLYHVQCPKCKTIYMCNGHIELIEITEPSESLNPIVSQ